MYSAVSSVINQQTKWSRSRTPMDGWMDGSASHPLRGRRGHGDAGSGPLGVELPAEDGLVAARLELPVLLAERAWQAAEVDDEVGAGRLGEAVLLAHPAAVRAGVGPRAPRRRQVLDEREQRRARPARRRAVVHDLRRPPERDARAPKRHAACMDA